MPLASATSQATASSTTTPIQNDTPAVLLVGDELSTVQALTAALEGLDASLVRASSREGALHQLSSIDFALILLDVELTHAVNAFETARSVWEQDRSRMVPVIFVMEREQDRPESLIRDASGRVDVLYKPLDPAVVRARVSTFLELHQLRDKSAVADRYREANSRLRASVAELEEVRRSAEIAQRAKDQFLATMSHEIRTPINAIIGYAQMIELGIAGPITEQQRDYLARLDAGSRHLLELVNDVLDLAKIDAGQMAVSREDAWTGPIVASALELVGPQAADRGVQLIDARAGQKGVAFVGDPRRVRQIVINLLANAVKFTNTGGKVTVECEEDREAPPRIQVRGAGPWACINITDTGIGVAPEHQARIFDAFQQVERGHTRTKGGIGLGLAISRRLARLMGGDLTMTSTLGKGSTFTLCLPAPQGDETAEQRRARAAPASFAAIRGLSEIGEALRDEVHRVIGSYSSRLRSDPATPLAATLRPPDLEDHAVTFLADIAQSLIMLDEAEQHAVDLLEDSTEIQQTIAMRHGRRRQRQGWSEASVARDFAILRDEAERVTASSEDLEQAFVVVQRLIERAEGISLRAWREAGRRSDWRD